MSEQSLVSYAQNGEDVVLWRALGHVEHGFYVDVGGWDPDHDSVTRLFHERGWRGINVEPVPEFAERFRQRRPHDEVVQAAVTDADADEVVLHRIGTTGLSTLDDDLADRHRTEGFESEDVRVPSRRLDAVLSESVLLAGDIHFLKVDVEGAEDQVLRSLDLERWRPWVLVVEATEPNSTVTTHERWEPAVLAAGWRMVLFDGLSRFYVSPDHPELADRLSYPACVLDGFVTAEAAQHAARVDDLSRHLEDSRREVIRWRGEAVTYWANAVAKAQASEDDAKLARSETAKVRSQLTRVREKLQQARGERRRLKARVQTLSARVRELEGRAEPLGTKVTRRARAAARKVVRG